MNLPSDNSKQELLSEGGSFLIN